MKFWCWILYGLASWLLLAGIWDHDWRLILASIATFAIYPFISAPVDNVVPTCSGCTKGRIVPGCPVHDPEQRKAAA